MEEQARPSLRVIWRLLKLMRHYKAKAVLHYVLLFAALGLELLRPVVVGWTINYITKMVSVGAGHAMNLIPFVLFLVGISLLRNMFRSRRGITQTAIVQGIMADIRCRLYDKVQRLSLEFHSNASSGDLIARSTRDVERIRAFYAHTVCMGPEIISYVIGSAVIIVSFDLWLAAASLVAVPVTAYLMVRFARRIRPIFKTASDLYDNVTTVLQENIAGARVVRAFGQEQPEIGKFSARAQTYTNQMIKAITVWADSIPFAMFVFRLSIPLTLFYGGVLVVENKVTLGAVTACLLYLQSIAERMRAIGRMVDFTQQASASAEKIFKLLDEEPRIAEAPDAKALAPGRGEVEFDNVSLDLGDQRVLDGVSFRVAPGETVALVGKTGCGKSSLISLLARFHDPTEGRVLIDGQDVSKTKLDSLRSDIGIVFQDTFLFSASVAENIRYGNPEASLGHVIECAEAAGAHPFVEKLERGYDTIIGERGVTLSGGEKQRVSIARALISDPRVLVLDDATASVDSYTEHGIHSAMRELSRNKTTFIISQRISTVQHANKIVVLDRGKVAQMGTHEALIRTKGIYREIYEGQNLKLNEREVKA